MLRAVVWDLGGTLCYPSGKHRGTDASAVAEVLAAHYEQLPGASIKFDKTAFAAEFLRLTTAWAQTKTKHSVYGAIPEVTMTSRMLEAAKALSYPVPPAPVLQKMVEAYFRDYFDGVALFPLAKEVLEYLKESGLRTPPAKDSLLARGCPPLPAVQTATEKGGRVHVIMLTNADCSWKQRALIRHLGIEHLFDAILVSAESATRKPDAHFHRQVEEWLSKQDPNLPKAQPHQIAMVGDMLSRDVVGGLRSGWMACWITHLWTLKAASVQAQRSGEVKRNPLLESSGPVVANCAFCLKKMKKNNMFLKRKLLWECECPGEGKTCEKVVSRAHRCVCAPNCKTLIRPYSPYDACIEPHFHCYSLLEFTHRLYCASHGILQHCDRWCWTRKFGALPWNRDAPTDPVPSTRDFATLFRAPFRIMQQGARAEHDVCGGLCLDQRPDCSGPHPHVWRRVLDAPGQMTRPMRVFVQFSRKKYQKFQRNGVFHVNHRADVYLRSPYDKERVGEDEMFDMVLRKTTDEMVSFMYGAGSSSRGSYTTTLSDTTTNTSLSGCTKPGGHPGPSGRCTGLLVDPGRQVGPFLHRWSLHAMVRDARIRTRDGRLRVRSPATVMFRLSAEKSLTVLRTDGDGTPQEDMEVGLETLVEAYRAHEGPVPEWLRTDLSLLHACQERTERDGSDEGKEDRKSQSEKTDDNVQSHPEHKHREVSALKSFSYPAVVKSVQSCGSRPAHFMFIIPNFSALASLPEGSWVMQPLIEHNGIVYKVYVMQPSSGPVFHHIHRKKSLPYSLPQLYRQYRDREKQPGILCFDSQKMNLVPYQPDSTSTAAPSRSDESARNEPFSRDLDQTDRAERVLASYIGEVASAMAKRVKLTFFGFDVLLHPERMDNVYVVDVNYFPSYAGCSLLRERVFSCLHSRIDDGVLAGRVRVATHRFSKKNNILPPVESRVSMRVLWSPAQCDRLVEEVSGNQDSLFSTVDSQFVSQVSQMHASAQMCCFQLACYELSNAMKRQCITVFPGIPLSESEYRKSRGLFVLNFMLPLNQTVVHTVVAAAMRAQGKDYSTSERIDMIDQGYATTVAKDMCRHIFVRLACMLCWTLRKACDSGDESKDHDPKSEKHDQNCTTSSTQESKECTTMQCLIDPCTGLPVMARAGSSGFDEVNLAVRLLGYDRGQDGCCWLVRHPQYGVDIYPASVVFVGSAAQLRQGVNTFMQTLCPGCDINPHFTE